MFIEITDDELHEILSALDEWYFRSGGHPDTLAIIKKLDHMRDR